LHYVDLLVISNAECSQYYGSIIAATTLCTSGAGGKGPCNVSYVQYLMYKRINFATFNM